MKLGTLVWQADKTLVVQVSLRHLWTNSTDTNWDPTGRRSSEDCSLKNSCGSCQDKNRTKRREQRQKNRIPWSLVVLERTLAIVYVKWSEAKLGMVTVRGYCNTDSEIKVTQESSDRGETGSNWGRARRLFPGPFHIWNKPSKPRKGRWQQRMIFHDDQEKE